ncbi:hypothetical protein GpartN1_g1084.t1 [Galdieria partita]|uniref:PNPLA domain-containing protein n=1 Tax=Galdieria partita TaxID=83374 RepID=A0A9C7UN21_9RHOD|nr:hypothetical protein GpartN1_g1084.t1 [Galdieria partita]
MRNDFSLCFNCKYRCLRSAKTFVVFINQQPLSNQTSNTNIVPSLYKATVFGRVSKRVAHKRCIWLCKVPEKNEKHEKLLKELWKLGWYITKFFSNSNDSNSDKYAQESVGIDLDGILRGETQDKESVQYVQRETLEQSQGQEVLQVTSTPTPTIIDMQTLEIVSLALNKSKTASRKGVDSVLPYEVQRVLFDSFCKGSSVPSKTSHLTKVGRTMRANGDYNDRIGSSSVKSTTSDRSKDSRGDTSKLNTEDSMPLPDAENRKIGVQQRLDNAERKELKVPKVQSKDESSTSQSAGVESTKSLRSNQMESKFQENVKRHYPEGLLDSSLRFLFNLAILWNPLSKAENLQNVANTSRMEQLDNVSGQPITEGSKLDSVETKRLDLEYSKGHEKTKGWTTYELIKAANDVRLKEDAEKFLDSDKIGQLIHDLTEDSEEIQAEAATALANLAAILPATRSIMLEFNDNQICQFSKSIICEGATRSVLRFRWKRPYRSSLHQTGRQIEVKMSILHLVGSLALCFEPAGRKWRREACEDKEFVAALKRFSRGTSGGYSEGVARCARRALACLGINTWSPRVLGQRGIRVLSFDGGGTRAIMTFEILKYLKRITGCEIHELFDVIGGTSTGGIIAATLGLRKRPIEEVEALYRELIGKIFTKTPVNTPKLIITRSYYDASILEGILKREAGRSLFIDSVTEDNANKVFVVSSIVSRKPHVIHLFRNYTFMEGKESRYEGSVEAQLWEGLRASSAAPTYFSEMRINGELYADGALVANNPTGVAIHETKKLFPNVPLELVVSIGTGRLTGSELPEATRRKESNLGWNDIITYLINSATSTESIHESLEDLLPPDKYFRLNPVTDSIDIDEVRPGKLAKMTELAQQYIRENEDRLELLGELLRPKPAKALHELLFDLFRVRGFYVDSFYQIGDDWYFPENF